MKHKKLLIALVLSIALLSGGIARIFGFSHANAGAEEWSAVKIESSYIYGETLTVPSRALTVGETSVNALFTVTYPSGKVTREASVRLGEVGDYTVRYYAKIGNRQYAMDEKFKVNGFGYETTNGNSSVAYSTYTELGANSTGLVVRLANKDKLTFTKLIDVTSLTSTDALVRFFITPDQRGVADFNKLTFTFADSADSSVYLRIDVNRSQFGGSGKGMSWCMAGGNGQDMIGLETKSSGDILHKNDDIGTPINDLSFIAQQNQGWSGPVSDARPDLNPATIAYDSATNSVYARSERVSVLDDPSFYEELWHGFPSGKVRLSVSAGGYSGMTANFCITGVYGMTTEELENNAFTDDEAPVISLAEDFDEIPEAEVGTAYPLLKATAYDDYSGICEVTTNVYYAYLGDSPVSVGVTDGKFVPSRAGDYAIEFTAKDSFSNASKKVVFVRAVEKIRDIEIEIPEEITTVNLGETVIVAAPKTSGGSGRVSVETTVVFEGNRTVINGSFSPEKQGEYTIEFVATDYLGKTAKASYKLTANAVSTPVFNEKVHLPAVYISGGSYVLPVIYANDYSSGSLKKVLCDVKVSDGNGEKTYKAGDKFVPAVNNNGDEIRITYAANGVNSETLSVPAIIGREGNTVYMSNYIYGKDVSVSVRDENGVRYSEGIEVSVNGNKEEAKWTFANSLVSEGASVTIKTLAGKTNFAGFSFGFSDSENGDLAAEIKVALGLKTVVVTHGGAEYRLVASVKSDGVITVSYTGGKIKVDCGNGATVNVPVTEYTDGSEFKEFPSGKVFLSVGAFGCSLGSKYLVTKICGNMLSYRNSDASAPSFAISGDYGGKWAKGSLYTIKSATAGDVFAPESTATLTVYMPDGSIAKDTSGKKLEGVQVNEEYTILLAEYGSYVLDYHIAEINWVGNARNFKPTVTAADDVAPEIEFVGKGTAEAKVGDVIVMPNYKVKDNVTAEENIIVSVYVINANGRYIKLENGSNSIKCEYAGKYTFMVMAVDEEGNSSSLKYEVTVK